jgi:cytochrome c-type biogenesis protein CcmH/NrfF
VAGKSFTRTFIFASLAALFVSAGCGTAPKEARPPEAAAPKGQAAPAAAPAAGAAAPASGTPDSPPSGTTAPPGSKMVSTAYKDVLLTPAAQVQAEKFMCVCGCKLVLAKCTCTNTPGSIDMKKHLQSLVSRGASGEEIEKEMIAKYGAAVVP